MPVRLVTGSWPPPTPLQPRLTPLLPPSPTITPLGQYADRPRRRLIALPTTPASRLVAPDGPLPLPLAHTKLVQPIPTSHAAPVSHTLLYLPIRLIAESPGFNSLTYCAFSAILSI